MSVSFASASKAAMKKYGTQTRFSVLSTKIKWPSVSETDSLPPSYSYAMSPTRSHNYRTDVLHSYRAPNGWWILWISTDIRGFGGCGLDSRWIGCRVGGCGCGYGWMTNKGEGQHGCPNWVVSSPNWLLSLSYSHSPYFPVICKYHQLNQFSS